MKFQPKSKSEIDSDGLLTPGEYDFEIVTAEDTISKSSGNEMIKLKVNVFDANGGKRTIFDYLMPSVAFKLRHAAEACGLEDEYESGNLEAFDFEGKTGRCKVNIQKDKSGQYPDKNGIADYIPLVTTGTVEKKTQRAKTKAEDLDDSIPF
jgi:hypothetical protein